MGTIIKGGRSFIAVILACLSAGIVSGGAITLGEALDAPELVWTTGGDAVWFAQTTNTYDNVDAVGSGTIGSNQTTWIETKVIGPATVNYWMRRDVPFTAGLGFSVNGTPTGESQMFSSDWNERTHDMGGGTNILRWALHNYSSDNSAGFVVLDQFTVGPPRPLAFQHEPSDETVYSGELVLFYGSAIGTPPIYYQWRKDGTNITGATNQWFLLEETTTNDSGIYSVAVSNVQDFLISTGAVLTVHPPTAPFFTMEPKSLAAYSGQSISLIGYVKGSPPFTFLWRKDGAPLPGATSFQLTLTNISEADAGAYTLVVSNGSGGIESSSAVLTVAQSVAPVIMRHPRSLEVAAGVSTWMSTVVTGAPNPCLRWSKLEEPPEPEPPLPFVCHQSRRSFNNVTTNDAGVYFVTAYNSASGVRSREALLTVLPPLSLKGSWAQGAEKVFVTNELAFLARGTNGLVILNVSNVSSPQMVGTYDTPGHALAVRVADGTAFLADGLAGLQILNVSDPTSPVLIGAYDTAGYAYDVIVRSNFAFVADGTAGLVILDISNLASPAFVGSYSTNVRAGSVCLLDDLAFVAARAPDVVPETNVAATVVIDISNPAQPTELGRMEGGVAAMDVHGSFVVAASRDHVKIISSSHPTQPDLIATFAFYGGHENIGAGCPSGKRSCLRSWLFRRSNAILCPERSRSR